MVKLFRIELTIIESEVSTPDRNACLNFLTNEYIVTGRNAKIEKGQPRITPVAAVATAQAGLSKRRSAEVRDIAYIEKELGRKPAAETTHETLNITKEKKRENYLLHHVVLVKCCSKTIYFS